MANTRVEQEPALITKEQGTQNAKIENAEQEATITVEQEIGPEQDENQTSVDWIDEDGELDKCISPDESEDEGDANPSDRRPKFAKFPHFRMLADGKAIRFKLGLDFGTKNVAKDAMCNYGLCNSKPMWTDKDDKKRLVVKCREGCPFYLRVSLNTQRQVWQVRKFIDLQTCPRQFKNPQAKTNLLGRKFLDRVKEDPNVNYKTLQGEAKKE